MYKFLDHSWFRLIIINSKGVNRIMLFIGHSLIDTRNKISTIIQMLKQSNICLNNKKPVVIKKLLLI